MYGAKTDVLGFGIAKGGRYPSDMQGGLPIAPNYSGQDNVRMILNRKPMLEEQREVPFATFSLPQGNLNAQDPTRNLFLDGGISRIPKQGLWARMKFNQ